jgi:hypothetical protein
MWRELFRSSSIRCQDRRSSPILPTRQTKVKTQDRQDNNKKDKITQNKARQHTTKTTQHHKTTQHKATQHIKTTRHTTTQDKTTTRQDNHNARQTHHKTATSKPQDKPTTRQDSHKTKRPQDTTEKNKNEPNNTSADNHKIRPDKTYGLVSPRLVSSSLGYRLVTTRQDLL